MPDNSCANPLLLEWIKEWLDQARERNSKGVSVYKKAYDSMKACPLTFHHPSEAQQLNGLGPKLCERLTAKLEEYCAENGLPMPELPYADCLTKASVLLPVKAKKRTSTEADDRLEEVPPKRTKKSKPYVPVLRSGAYALLLALATIEESSSVGATKAQLIEAAQPHCDASFTAPADPTKFYTAWNSMKTLVRKDLVYEHGRPLKRYLLTDQGWETAKAIQKTAAANSGSAPSNTLPNNRRFGQENPNPSQSSLGGSQYEVSAYPSGISENVPCSQRSNTIDLSDFDETPEASASRQCTSTMRSAAACDYNRQQAIPSPVSDTLVPLSPRDFTIELVLDVREIRTPKDRDYISNELIRRGVTPIVRALELGDALWVAKCKNPRFLAQYGEEGDEIMLDWIIERKRLDDLVGSIKDGRFHEQKFRLRRSGVKNVIYLIEEFAFADPSSATAARSQEAIASAIASTQVVNGYFVKKTRNLDDTIRYLARMTSLLRRMFTDPCTSTNSANDTRPSSSITLIPTSSITSVSSYLDLLNRLRDEDDKSKPGNRSSANTLSSPTTTTYAITFPTFSALSSKSDMLTLRDLFLKMLMCTRGLTGEKALEIQRRWPTPRQFVEALQAVDTGDEQGKKRAEELVFSKMGELVGRKKVGKALSKRIAEVWGRQR
ncbi:Crossover junction endonuclease mus81 [Emydomyces testavorans]|uniref:Crossover junction endonuclease MUS81 n=1 Tax=Emydomyces testavorans TaxID=2070801 RepID=A0AAF0DBM9_9EURO|nr:Crossover junction endonuclease mus81 [Emydomyces testavorans]